MALPLAAASSGGSAATSNSEESTPRTDVKSDSAKSEATNPSDKTSVAPATGGDKGPATKPDQQPEPKFMLRYRFKPGESISWQVEHRAEVRTTVSGTTQTAETNTTSIKVWKVTDCQADGRATFVHSVESVDMRQKLTGRQEVRYNSRTDVDPPVGFQDVAKSVGVPLSEITLDATGTVLKRLDKQPRPPNQSSHITIPLPAEAVPVGHHWSVPYETNVTTKDGSTRMVKLRQQMTLTAVKNGVATIEVDNQVLSPVNDPTMDAQLVQSETTGKIRFDIDAGRLLSQISDGDKNVIGFQGEASSLHYVTRFTEKLMTDADKKKIAGPAAPTSKPSTSKAASAAATTTAAPPAATNSTGKPAAAANPATNSAVRPAIGRLSRVIGDGKNRGRFS